MPEAGDKDKFKKPGLFDLLTPDSFWPFGRKKRPRQKEVLSYAGSARDDWRAAVRMFRAGVYDQAVLLFRAAVEKLLKANYAGLVGESVPRGNLVELARGAFREVPEEVRRALVFLNPHGTLTRSSYDRDLAEEVRENALRVVRWLNEKGLGECFFDYTAD